MGENARFVADRPRSIALQERARGSMPSEVPMMWMEDFHDHPAGVGGCGEGSRFTDVDGHGHLDMYVSMANRGVWESGWWLGPTVSAAHSEGDVDTYVELFDEFLMLVT